MGIYDKDDEDRRFSRYANLEDICGGRITVERLEVFRKAIPEFYLFIEMMGRLLAPAEEEWPKLPSNMRPDS